MNLVSAAEAAISLRLGAIRKAFLNAFDASSKRFKLRDSIFR